MTETWADILRRRCEGDPLMKGGQHRSIDEVRIQDVRCAKAKCQSRNVRLSLGYGICLDCNHAWKRRK